MKTGLYIGSAGQFIEVLQFDKANPLGEILKIKLTKDTILTSYDCTDDYTILLAGWDYLGKLDCSYEKFVEITGVNIIEDESMSNRQKKNQIKIDAIKDLIVKNASCGGEYW